MCPCPTIKTKTLQKIIAKFELSALKFMESELENNAGMRSSPWRTPSETNNI